MNTASDEITQFLALAEQRSVLRFCTMGSVDDGKSTLIGRLLHDSKNIYDDHLESIGGKTAGGVKGLELALVTDGLRAEREQGITIDVAYRYFSTPKRNFILADTPGHEQYTRNMATGASTAHLAILVLDARKGVLAQTKRHAFIASLLGIPRCLVAVNKMDLVDYSEDVFNKIRADVTEFARKLDIKSLKFIPISALQGDNVVERSEQMPWYQAESVMSHLEEVYVGGDTNLVDLRLPVQYVIRPNQDYRGYAGRLASGSIRVGDEVLVLPSKKRSRVKTIDVMSSNGSNAGLNEAFAPMSVALSLEDEVDISRGDMIVRPNNMPRMLDRFEAMVVWMSEQEMDQSKRYAIQHATQVARVEIDDIRYKVDINTLHRLDPGPLALNEIGRFVFSTNKALMLDAYSKNRATGSFIIIDPATNHTVACGMVIDRIPPAVLGAERQAAKEPADLHREAGLVSYADRCARYQCRPMTLWLSGYSGSGKSSIAGQVERILFERGYPVYRLDGDNLRMGLNNDLRFSSADRTENLRRAAEVAKLFNDAGSMVICSFISPTNESRERAREIIGAEAFVEVFVDTPLDVCEQRDPHGLYKKARAGEIAEFTGISAPFEAPENPDLRLETTDVSAEGCAQQVVELLQQRGVIDAKS